MDFNPPQNCLCYGRSLKCQSFEPVRTFLPPEESLHDGGAVASCFSSVTYSSLKRTHIVYVVIIYLFSHYHDSMLLWSPQNKKNFQTASWWMNHDSEGGCQRTVELTLNVWSVSIPAVPKRGIFLMIKADFSLHFFLIYFEIIGFCRNTTSTSRRRKNVRLDK